MTELVAVTNSVTPSLGEKSVFLVHRCHNRPLRPEAHLQTALWLLAALACSGSQENVTTYDGADTPVPAFDAPWEGLEATEEASGAFDATLGDELAGPGWFHTGSDRLWGSEGAWARQEKPTGASNPVTALSVGGRDGASVVVLQLTVSDSAWGAGDITVDGAAAAGVLVRLVEGAATPLAYVVSGTIELEEAGTEDGDTVRGTFTDLGLAEVPE